MLLKNTELEAIRAGLVSLIFRRWRKPTVKTGGTLLTGIGLLAIDRVTLVERSRITANDARKAGFESLAGLLQQLDAREGDIYRIEVRLSGADPRIELREQAPLSSPELDQLVLKLARLDAASRVGHWTLKIMQAIHQTPHLAAVDLAAQTGYEKEWLKTNIRKLKNLGLTISHHPGYELSPRGISVLRFLSGK